MRFLIFTIGFAFFLFLNSSVFSQEGGPESQVPEPEPVVVDQFVDEEVLDTTGTSVPADEAGSEEAFVPNAEEPDSLAPVAETEILTSVVTPPLNEKHVNTLLYGTETEIAALIQTLRNENDPSMDDTLLELAMVSKNKTILAGIFSFFGERGKTGLEERAIQMIEEREFEANETVIASIDYLGRLNAFSAVDTLKELIIAGENSFLNNGIRALGRAGKGSKEAADSAAEFLLDYYTAETHTNENQREIIVALGETGSSLGVTFISELVNNTEERVVLRMAGLDALGKIGDIAGLDAIIGTVSAADPNVRSSAIAALGPFSGEEADQAILEGFRDSYYRTRIGAAQAAAKRKLEAAVPYLKFRAENDDVPAAKDEAIKALGAIWNKDAIAILESIFFDRKTSDRARILAGEMLLKNDAATYTGRGIAELDDAKVRNQTALYNGFLRILSPGVTADLEGLARRFLTSGSVIEKSYALDMAQNNMFTSLEPEIRSCLDERRNSAGLARKAQSTLEKLGLEQGSESQES